MGVIVKLLLIFSIIEFLKTFLELLLNILLKIFFGLSAFSVLFSKLFLYSPSFASLFFNLSLLGSHYNLFTGLLNSILR